MYSKMSTTPPGWKKVRGTTGIRVNTTLHYTTLHYTTLLYTTLHYTTLPYTTLHYTTLHYPTLHYTTLPYTTTTGIRVNTTLKAGAGV